MIIGTLFFMLLAALTQYAELVWKFEDTFDKPEDTKPVGPIERAKTSIILLLIISTLSSCNLIIPIGEQKYTTLRTIKKGTDNDGFNEKVAWRGDDLHINIKFMANCWYEVPSEGYGKDVSINKIGGIGEWTFPFDFHRCNSARAGWIPDTHPDSIQVGTFVHFKQNTTHQYALTVRTNDDWAVHIHNSLPERKYRYTFTYKQKVVTLYEPMGDVGIGYLLFFHGGGDTYKAPQNMTALLRYSEK